MSLLTSIPSGLSAFDKTHGIISHPILYISLYIYLYQIIISHPKISHYYILHFMHIDDELPSPWPNSPCDAHQLRARHRNPPGVGSASPCPNALGSPCHESPGETMDRGNFGWASKGFKCKLLLRGGLREMVGGNSSGNVTNVLKKVPAVVLWFGRRMQYTHDRLLPLRNI
jgi:hypothetical protein